MKPQSRIFDILLAFCWVMIVVTGSLALGSYWSRRPVSSLQPQSSAAPAAPLLPMAVPLLWAVFAPPLRALL